jgi:hypothetical protein
MPGSSTTPGRPGARAHAPISVAFRFRNGVGTRDMNLCEAQWLAYVLPYRRFAVVLTDDHARLGADVVRYAVIASDLHRLLVAGLPAHCERLCTSSGKTPQRPSAEAHRSRNKIGEKSVSAARSILDRYSELTRSVKKAQRIELSHLRHEKARPANR